MPYNPKAIANYFLALAETHGRELTPMKIQKLVFYAHGWNLALYGRPLIDEQVEAWPYGPVIRSLYRAFREYGNSPITGPAYEIEPCNPGSTRADIVFPRLDDRPEESAEARRLLDRIWDVYGGFSAIQLSNATHTPDGPWARVMEEYKGAPPRGTDIPTRYIEDYFLAQSGSEARTNGAGAVAAG